MPALVCDVQICNISRCIELQRGGKMLFAITKWHSCVMRAQEQLAYFWNIFSSAEFISISVSIRVRTAAHDVIGCVVHSELLINRVQCETLGCVCFHLIVRSSIAVCLFYWFELICDAKCFAVIGQGHTSDQLTQLRTRDEMFASVFVCVAVQ